MNSITLLITTLILSCFTFEGSCVEDFKSERRKREVREDRLEMTQEQNEDQREVKFRTEARKRKADGRIEENADDLFLSERDASDFLGDRDSFDESPEERLDRKREAAEDRREEARKTPREKTSELREKTRERRSEL